MKLETSIVFGTTSYPIYTTMHSFRTIFYYIPDGSVCYMRIGNGPSMDFTVHKTRQGKTHIIMDVGGRLITNVFHLFNTYNKYVAYEKLPYPENIFECIFSRCERFEDCSFHTILGCTPEEWNELPALVDDNASSRLITSSKGGGDNELPALVDDNAGSSHISPPGGDNELQEPDVDVREAAATLASLKGSLYETETVATDSNKQLHSINTRMANIETLVGYIYSALKRLC